MANHGVLNLLKPPGMTSHDAVAHVRRVLKTKRVGHTGTLDPAAAGVLPICVGLATRLVETLQVGTKEYVAEATFGFETDTLDAVGEVVRQSELRALNLEQLEAICAQFRGDILQRPPMHSAIKVGGQKLYDIARAGGDIEVAARPVTISALEITRFFPATSTARPRAFLRIECSGGTYIRSLVRDVGRALDSDAGGDPGGGSGGGGAATMTFLSRSRNGTFVLRDAVTPQEFEISPRLTPLTEVLRQFYGAPIVDDASVNALWQGKTIESAVEAATVRGTALWSNASETLLALAEPQNGGRWKPTKVFDLRD